MRVVLVHHRQVVVDVLLLLHHAAQTVLHDDRELVLEGGIVSDAVRDGARHDVAVTILVLQPFAVQRRAAGSGADEEPARAHVSCRPGQIADALEPEHRIEEVDGDHLHAVGAVGRARRDPRGDGARLVDSLLEDLPVLRFLVEHQLIGILRPVQLADVRVDAVLPEHAFHAERARLVGDDGDHPGPDVLVAQERGEDPDEGHGGGQLAFSTALELCLERRQRRRLQRLRLAAPARQASAQFLEALLEPPHLRAVLRRPVEGHLLQLIVGDRQVEAIAKHADLVCLHLLRLVGDVLPLHGLAHPEALDRLRQDDRRLSLLLARGLVGGVDLDRIVAAAAQRPDLLVGPVRDHRRRLRIPAEELLPHERPVARLERLVVAVDTFLHQLPQAAGGVAREQRVPVRAPDDLDHAPARAAEARLQLLDDLAVAAHGPVEALQVAVHHEDQVVELLAPGHRDRAERFRLVGLSVADEAPHLAALGLRQAAILKVAEELGLVDGHDRPEAHADRGELPEVGHQPGMRVAREPAPVDLLAEVPHVPLVDAALEERARIETGRRVALQVEEIAAVLLAGRMPEMIEADVIERRAGRVARHVPAELGRFLVRDDYQRHRVPPRDRREARLDLEVGRPLRLRADRNRVHVRRRRAEWKIGARLPHAPDQPFQQEAGAIDALVGDDRVDRVEPLAGFDGVGVLVLRHETILLLGHEISLRPPERGVLNAWIIDLQALPVCVEWGVLHRRGKAPAAVRHGRLAHGAVGAMRQAMTLGKFAPVFRARALLDGVAIAPGMHPAHTSGVHDDSHDRRCSRRGCFRRLQRHRR